MNLHETKVDDKEKIAQIVHEQIEGMISKDTTKLREVIAPDAKLYHITGAVQSRDQWLHEIEKGRMNYFANHEVLFQVEVNGNHAKVISRNELDARINGFRNTWPLQTITDLEKINGQWYIIESKSSMY